MEIRQIKAGNVAKLLLSGRFDFNSHRNFKDAYSACLADKEVTVLEVHLTDVGYMDSSALGMLLLLRERGEGMSKKVILCEPNEIVAQILEIANFNKLFTIINV